MNTAAPRPPAPKVLGILSLVFGGIVILLNLVALTLSGMGAFEDSSGITERATQRYLEAIEPSTTIVLFVMLAMSAALIFVGIGQLKYKQWARKGAIAWGLAGIVVLVGMVIQHYMVVGPALEAFVDALSDVPGVKDTMGAMTGAGGIITIVMYLPYPIIQIALMSKPAVVAAMDN